MQSPSHIGVTRLNLSMIILPIHRLLAPVSIPGALPRRLFGVLLPAPSNPFSWRSLTSGSSAPILVRSKNRVPSSAMVTASVYSACQSLYLPAHSCGCRAPSAPRIADVSFSAAPRSDSCEGAVAVIDGYRVTSRLYALLPSPCGANPRRLLRGRRLTPRGPRGSASTAFY